MPTASLGVRLDGGRGYNYGAMFERDSMATLSATCRAGAAIKFQVSNTVLKYGNQMPMMPVLTYDDSACCPSRLPAR